MSKLRAWAEVGDYSQPLEEMHPVAAYDRGMEHGIEFGSSQRDDVLIAMLEDRICFDHKEKKNCEHSVCFNNADLIIELRVKK